MKFLLIYIAFISLIEKKESGINDYDSDLTRISNDFRENIFNEDECTNLKNDVNDVADEIEEDLDADDYSTEEKQQLTLLLQEAEALKDYIACVGNCGNSIPSIEKFNLANRRVKGNVSIVILDKYCVDVISVTIGKYVCYLAENNTINNFTINYKWATPNGMHNGNGTMGLYGKSVRHIYDNRDKIEQTVITVSDITCAKF